MKILVADKLDPAKVADLEKRGAEIDLQPNLTADELPEEIKDAEILIVRSTKVSARVMEMASSLSLIIRAGAGVNTIDVATASACGVYVCNWGGCFGVGE